MLLSTLNKYQFVRFMKTLNAKISKQSIWHWLVPACVLVYFLAVFQDYLFAVLRNTGFYWSETLLFNCYWLLYLPFTGLLMLSIRLFVSKNFSSTYKVIIRVLQTLFFAALHLLVFTLFFCGISLLVFHPAHDFTHMLKSILSNYTYLTLLAYAFLPFLIQLGNEKFTAPAASGSRKDYPQHLMIKKGNRQVRVDLADIQYFQSDRPYVLAYSEDEKYVLSQSLKSLEKILDPAAFIRVHRSTILQKKFLQSLRSRSNGDYDAQLRSGQQLRLSRHYREQWQSLISESSTEPGNPSA